MGDGMVRGLNKIANPSCLSVGIAVNSSRKIKHVVRWALDKFVPEGMCLFKLFFIRPKITTIPTPMGSLQISQVREDVALAYKKEVAWQTNEKLIPFKNMCARRKVEVEIVQIESDGVVDAIKLEIMKNNISKLVIGASSKGTFSRGQNLSSRICENTPSFCTVYVISKTGLSSVRASYSEKTGHNKDSNNSSFSSCITSSSRLASSSRIENNLLDAISCKSFNKNEFITHTFKPDDIFYMEQTKKSMFEPQPIFRTTGTQTRTRPSRSLTPTRLVTIEGTSNKRAREDSKDMNEEKALVQRRRRGNSPKKSSPKSDVAVIDQLARHLHGDSSPQGTEFLVAVDQETSDHHDEPNYSDEDHGSPAFTTHEPYFGSDACAHMSKGEIEHQPDPSNNLDASSNGKQLDLVTCAATSATPSADWVSCNKHVKDEKDAVKNLERKSKIQQVDQWVEDQLNISCIQSKIQQVNPVASEVMALRAKEKCWDMKKVILSLNDTEVGQGAGKSSKTKETIESLHQLVKAQRRLYRLHVVKQIERQTNVETECLRLREANIAMHDEVAVMKENIDSMSQQLLENVADHASQIADLKGVIDILTEEKNWLLTQGFIHFAENIRSSAEMINAVAKVNTAANRVGYNEGIKAGYHYALEASILIHEVPELQVNAYNHLEEATKEFEHTSFPCVAEIAKMVGAPFEQIKSFIQTPREFKSA